MSYYQTLLEEIKTQIDTDVTLYLQYRDRFTCAPVEKLLEKYTDKRQALLSNQSSVSGAINVDTLITHTDLIEKGWTREERRLIRSRAYICFTPTPRNYHRFYSSELVENFEQQPHFIERKRKWAISRLKHEQELALKKREKEQKSKLGKNLHKFFRETEITVPEFTLEEIIDEAVLIPETFSVFNYSTDSCDYFFLKDFFPDFILVKCRSFLRSRTITPDYVRSDSELNISDKAFKQAYTSERGKAVNQKIGQKYPRLREEIEDLVEQIYALENICKSN